MVFLLAVLARLVGQVLLGAYSQPGVFEYETIANNLLSGHGYTYASPDGGLYVASQSSPLYIVLTAGVYLLTNHSQAAMLVLQALLGGATAVLAMWLGGYAFSRPAGIVAGTLVALDPALIAYSSQLHRWPGSRASRRPAPALLLALGLLTPLAAAGVIGTLFVASSVHWKNGLWGQDGGFELPLFYALTAAVLAFTGPGAYSLDNAVGLDNFNGVGWGVLATAVGLLAGCRRRQPRPAVRWPRTSSQDDAYRPRTSPAEAAPRSASTPEPAPAERLAERPATVGAGLFGVGSPGPAGAPARRRRRSS